jgi:hypothetical protein
MKNVLKIFAIVAVIGFSFAACSDDGGGGGGGGGAPPPVTIDGNFIGTWTGTMYGENTIVIVTNTTWKQYIDDDYWDGGYFTSWNGTSGNIYSNVLKKVVGTATLTSSNAATIVLNSNALYPGTYYFTKTP